jgi:hypothetical protein
MEDTSGFLSGVSSFLITIAFSSKSEWVLQVMMNEEDHSRPAA